MEIRLEKNNELSGFIKIRLDEADYRPQVDKKLKEYAKKANLKGFRPGKVPVGLITKMYGKSVLVDEVNNIAVDNLQKYVKDENINLIASPIFDPAKAEGIDWDNPATIEFHYEVGLSPEVGDLPIEKIQLTEYEVAISDQALEDMINTMKEMFAEHEHPETVGENDEVSGLVKKEGSDVKVSGRFKLSDVKEGKQALFLGQAGRAELNLVLEDVFSAEVLESKFRVYEGDKADFNGAVTFTITHIGRKNPLKSDQEFYDKAFGAGRVTSKEEFEEQVKALLEKRYKIESEELLSQNFQEAAANLVSADLPEGFLKKWLQTQHRLPENEVDRYFPEFRKGMRWEVVKNKLIETEKLENYQPEHLIEYLKKRFFLDFYYMNYFVTDDSMLFGAINHFLQNSQQDNQRLVSYESGMISLQLLDRFRDKMQVTKKTVSPEEFAEALKKTAAE